MLDVRIVLFDVYLYKTSSIKGATNADNTACIGYDLIFLQKFSVYRKKSPSYIYIRHKMWYMD